MRRLGIPLSLALLVLAGACGDDATPPVDGAGPDTGPPDGASAEGGGTGDPLVDRAVGQIAADLEAADVPGASVAIVRGWQEPVFAGIGVRNLDEGGEIGPHTVFRVASLSKLVLATMILSLVEDGALSLDDRVVDRLPSFHVAGDLDPSTMTLRQLLMHTAGLQDLEPVLCPESGAREWLEAHPDVELWAPPGETWSYSNTGFTVAAAIAETVTGRPFRDVAQERVLDPAGMDDATYDPQLAATRDHASGTDLGGSTTVLGIADLTCPALDGSGGLIASASDYQRFVRALFGPEPTLLSPSSVASLTAMAESQRVTSGDRYGLGINLHDDRPELGARLLWHVGDLPGYRSAFALLPDDGLLIVLLTNGNPFTPLRSAMGAMATLRGMELLPVSDPPATAEDRTRVAGHYVDPFGHLGDVRVEVLGDELHATIPGVGFDGTLTSRNGGWRADNLFITFQPVEGTSEWLVTSAGVARRVE